MKNGDQQPVKYDKERLRKLGRPQTSCEICGGVGYPRVRDHCHRHGWERGVLCNYCNGLMQSIDRGALPGRYFSRAEARSYVLHWLKCPDCRTVGWAETAYCKCDQADPPVSRYDCAEPPSQPPCPWIGTGYRSRRQAQEP
jgi:hypothetical protein